MSAEIKVVQRMGVEAETLFSVYDTAAHGKTVFFPGIPGVLTQLRIAEHHFFLIAVREPKDRANLVALLSPSVRGPIRFCNHESEKIALCRDLGLTSFVDSTLSTLTELPEMVIRRFLFRPRKSELRQCEKMNIIPADSWLDIQSQLQKM
jgi:hypothetical protein